MLFNKFTKTTSSYVTSFNGASRFRGDDLWPDFQKWYILIEDPNDSDGDGVPDLSDQIDNSNKGHLSSLPILLFSNVRLDSCMLCMQKKKAKKMKNSEFFP